YHAAGDIAGAHDTWRQALRLHEALDHPDTNEVRRRLLEPTDAGLVYNANLLNAHWGEPANHDGTIGRLGMRMTRPAAMLAAMTLTVAVAACSSTSSSSGGTPAGKAQQGGTVTVAWTNATPNFIFPFPPATNTDGYNANLTNPMWPTLSVDGDGAQSAVNRRESLYSSLTFGNGNKTVTMVLKSWKWSDGAPITSRDFTFVYNLLKTNYQNWNSYIPGTFPVDVTGVSATDTHTVVLTLSQPTSPDF